MERLPTLIKLDIWAILFPSLKTILFSD